MRAAFVVIALTLPVAAFAKEPRSVDQSQRSAKELADCVTLKLVNAKGYEISRQPLERGEEIKLKFRVTGIAATAATFKIEDAGTHRTLTIFATGKATGAPRTIAENARECVR